MSGYGNMFKGVGFDRAMSMPVVPDYLSGISQMAAGLQIREPMIEVYDSIQKFADIAAGMKLNFDSIGFRNHGMENWDAGIKAAAGLSGIDLTAMTGISAAIQAIQPNYQSYLDAYSRLSDIFKDVDLDRFGDEEISVNDDGSLSMDGENYSLEEIPVMMEQQAEEINSASFSLTNTIEDLKKKYKLFLFCIRILFMAAEIYGCGNAFQEMYQTVMTKYNGWENLYYIGNENGAAVYQEPSTDSPVITRATYSNAVLKTEDAKLWVKVKYQDGEEEKEGWIAKRNLIPYAEVQFDRD